MNWDEKIESLTNQYATSYEELEDILRFACEWQTCMGKFGLDFKKFLMGIYPAPYLEKCNIDELIQMSNEAKRFVDYWNRATKIEKEVIKINKSKGN